MPRTEQEVLKDFEKLGYKVNRNTNFTIVLENNNEIELVISKVNHWYTCKITNSISSRKEALYIDMEEHKLLTELFTIWGWLDE